MNLSEKFLCISFQLSQNPALSDFIIASGLTNDRSTKPIIAARMQTNSALTGCHRDQRVYLYIEVVKISRNEKAKEQETIKQVQRLEKYIRTNVQRGYRSAP